MTRWRLLEWPFVLPVTAGVYVIFIDGKLTYVGQSGNLNARFAQYKIRVEPSNNIFTPWGVCRHLACKVSLYMKYGDWLMREARLIRRLSPPANRLGVFRRVGQ